MIFYEETEFQDSRIGKIPKDWEVAKMDTVAYVKGRIGWRGLKASEYTTKGPYLIANKHLANNRIIWDKCDHLSEFRYEESSEIQLQMNDVIISKDGTIGQPAFIEFLPDRATINSTMMLLRITNSILEPKFLFYFLQGPHFRRFLKQKISGTSIPHLFQRDMKELRVLLPSIEEQKGIVGVLDVVDSAILKVDEVIWKTERLKKGLMQQLLTRGIGHKEYKDTPIGKIPVEWHVSTLIDICEVTDGSHWSPKEVEMSNYRIATVANLKETHIDIDSCKSISEEDYQRLVKERDVPEKGDILFSKDGTVGICFSFKHHGNNIGLLSSIAILRPNQKVLFPEFGSYALKSPKVFWQVIGRKTGTALRRITLEHLKTVKIPIPSLLEQQKIAEILSSVDKKLELEKNEKTKLERIKRGLMNLLLTGKVRVKVD